MVFLRKFNFFTFFTFFWGKSVGKFREYCFDSVFSELIVYFKGIFKTLSKFYCILLLTLLRYKFGIGGNYALFGVKFFRLKFGWCKGIDILHVCSDVNQNGIICIISCFVVIFLVGQFTCFRVKL